MRRPSALSAVYEALQARRVATMMIYDITKIDCWFLDKLQHLVDIEDGPENRRTDRLKKYLSAKKFGFPG